MSVTGSTSRSSAGRAGDGSGEPARSHSGSRRSLSRDGFQHGGGTTTALRLLRVPITHPDAARLVEAVQQEYVERYGGRDDSPVDPGEFEGDLGRFVIGYDGDEPVVTGAWRRRPVPAGGPGTSAVELKRMYVVPAARGRGFARAMLAHLEESARAAGADVVVLETGTRQPEAIALYEASGYIRIPGFGQNAPTKSLRGRYKDEPLSRCFARALR